MDLGLIDGRYFQDIKSRGVQKQKRNGRKNPNRRLDYGHSLNLPKLQTIVAMIEKIDNPDRGQW
jgi:hypothetical protein